MSEPAHLALASSYSPWLVLLSVCVATIASYTALVLAERVTVAQGYRRLLWLLGGATAMGGGIWSMHFTGMLALHLSRPITYDLPTVALSLAAAMMASGIALVVVSRPELTLRSWLFGGLLMGFGIATMHYTGMAAIRMDAETSYAPALVVVSIGIAIIVALVALRLAFHLRNEDHRGVGRHRVVSAAIMGLAIAGMHYTGMAAATFLPVTSAPVGGITVGTSILGAVAIALATFIVLGLALAVARVERHLAAQSARFRALTIHASDLVLIVRSDGVITYASPASRHVLGHDPSLLVGQPAWSFIYPQDQGHLRLAIEQMRTQSGLGGPHRYRIRHADGSWRTIETRSNVRLDDPAIAGMIINLRDISERVAVEERLTLLQRRHETLLNAAGEGIFGLDLEGRTTFVNPAAANLLGYDIEDLIGGHMHQVIHHSYPDARPYSASDCPIYMTLRDGVARHVDTEVFWRKDKTAVTIDYYVTAVREDDRVAGAVVTFQDITARRAAEAALRHQAMHDALTTLPNRVLLNERLNAQLAAEDNTALLLLDLDRFKEVNDTLGHQTGDLLLRQVAERLITLTQGGDTVARLGGDEFAVLLAATDNERALDVAQAAFNTLDAPYEIEGQVIRSGISIGIAVAPVHGRDAGTLLRHADVAMYTAKRGRSGVALYDQKQDIHSPERLFLLGELRDAIAAGTLCLYYQPKAALDTGAVRAVEALVRWPHPQRGLIMPGQFIPLAEATGVIRPLTWWVLKEAIRQCSIWQQEGYPLEVAVNLSAQSLHDPTLPETVGTLLRAAGVPSTLLRLEVTESAVMEDADRALKVLASLAALGVRLSIDDFGTGYSSLAYLKRLPVDELKIDQAFIRHLSTDNADATIVRSTIGLGHSLGLKVVAEGVEDQATWHLLARTGCDSAQGYFLARPLHPNDLDRWLAERMAPATQSVA